MTQFEIDAMAATLEAVRINFNAAAASFNLAAVAMNDGDAALQAAGVDPIPGVAGLNAVSSAANTVGPLVKALIDRVAKMVGVPDVPANLVATVAP